MEEGGEAIELKVRGPPESGPVAFFFMEDLLAMIDQVCWGLQQASECLLLYDCELVVL